MSRDLARRETISGYLFLLPSLLFFLVFVVYPMIMCVVTSLTDASMGANTTSNFIGLKNYVDLFQENGGSMIMIAKGNRSQQVTDACQKHGGFYLGSIGGPAAILAKNNIKKEELLDSIKSVELLEYPELGMEAIWKIEVEDFPAFILVDDKGNDFFAKIREGWACAGCGH